MDAGNLSQFALPERTIRESSGYGFLRDCSVLYADRFWCDLPENQKAGNGKRLQNLSLSVHARTLPFDWNGVLYSAFDLQTGLYFARFGIDLAWVAGLLFY